jgi:IS30 family transposase
LSLRELIATKFNEQGKSIRQIAKEIEVSPNTVSQEIYRTAFWQILQFIAKNYKISRKMHGTANNV